MKDLSEQFEKYDTIHHAKKLEEYCKPRGLCVRDTALGLSIHANEVTGDFEEAMTWCSVALYEAYCEQGLMKK